MSKLSKLRRDIIRNPDKYRNTRSNAHFDIGAKVYRIKGKVRIGYISHWEQAHKKFIRKVLATIDNG